MIYESLRVPIDSIDLEDDAYMITTAGSLRSLLESIRIGGLINPPLVKKRHDKCYRIVCGRRRILCCQVLGWSELSAYVVPDSLDDLHCLKLAISDNRSHRSFNLIEQSRGIVKLTCLLPEEDRFHAICLLLDIPFNQNVFNKIQGLSKLPRSVQNGILQGELSLEGAVTLFPFEPSEQIAFFELFKELNLSQRKECELITLIDEIAKREAVPPIEVIKSKPVLDIISEKHDNRSEKTRKVRLYLKRKRFPLVTETEDRFFTHLKHLKLGNSIQLSPPPYFEGNTYKLRLSFKSLEELKQQLEVLAKSAEKPAFRSMIQKE